MTHPEPSSALKSWLGGPPLIGWTKVEKCVYLHIRKDTKKVFYIGMGSIKRATQTSGRNRYWKHIANKAGFSVKIISKNLTSIQAAKLEERLVSLYWSRNQQITNIMPGGLGKFTRSSLATKEETKNKLSISGKAYWANKTEVQQKQLSGLPQKLPIICDTTGEVFDSIYAASKAHKVNVANLHKHLYGIKYSTIGGRTYSWLSR